MITEREICCGNDRWDAVASDVVEREDVLVLEIKGYVIFNGD